jgi:putative SOS response-associated peptidase YedK
MFAVPSRRSKYRALVWPLRRFSAAEAIARIFGTVNPLPNFAPSWNVAPTQGSAIVRRHPSTGYRHLDMLKWGLLPHWTTEPAPLAHVGARGPGRSARRLTSGMVRLLDRN